MPGAIHWWGNASVTGRNEVPTLEDFELDGRYLYEEKLRLIEALEKWLMEGEPRLHNFWRGSRDGWDGWG